MSVSNKNFEIACGPTICWLGKGEPIQIPSEEAGEKRVPKEQNLLETHDLITAHAHTAVLDEKGNVVKRIDEKGKVLTEKEENQKDGEDR